MVIRHNRTWAAALSMSQTPARRRERRIGCQTPAESLANEVAGRGLARSQGLEPPSLLTRSKFPVVQISP